MARRRKPVTPPPVPPAAPAQALSPAEVGRGDVTAAILGFMMFLTPALGASTEELLQDTLKSIVVSFAALIAGLLFFWRERGRSSPLRWHGLVWLPLALMGHALGSMAWSHTYLAGVEAIRWFVFSLLLWLGLNTLSRERLPQLAWGVHAGVVVASLWAALQFWIDWRFFPQGPKPASTFVNRNFFAEFAACALPFSFLLLARARQRARIAGMALSTGLVLVAVMMTGTRGALIAVWVQLLLVLPLIAWLYRRELGWVQWPAAHKALAGGLLLATVLGLGSIPTGSAEIAGEGRGLTPIARALTRTESIGPSDTSLGVRMVMWRATLRMIADRPLSGVGAGAWESEIPLYQSEGSQLETDYYVHNEVLQLLAEYGFVGGAFLLLLLAYLAQAAWRTVATRGDTARAEAPWRAAVLTSLLALLIVSNIGFPWRMAATGALFALCLGALAASDARLGLGHSPFAVALPWKPAFSGALAAGLAGCMVMAAYITQQAVRSEQKIVAATRMALTITASRDPNNPRWDPAKAQMLRQMREGIAINPHYRKITPMVADELARWGDWRNATWIWESVLTSRPYIVAIMSNVARGHAAMGETQQAWVWVQRAKAVQPNAASVRSMEMILLARSGREAEALALARQMLDAGIVDYDLANGAFVLAWRAQDWALAERAMQVKLSQWPQQRVASYLQLGQMYDTGMKDRARAQEAFSRAVRLLPAAGRAQVKAEIPPGYWEALGLR